MCDVTNECTSVAADSVSSECRDHWSWHKQKKLNVLTERADDGEETERADDGDMAVESQIGQKRYRLYTHH